MNKYLFTIKLNFNAIDDVKAREMILELGRLNITNFLAKTGGFEKFETKLQKLEDREQPTSVSLETSSKPENTEENNYEKNV